MEKAAIAKSKIRFLMFLSKPAAAVKLQNQSFSPAKINANKLKAHQNKGFSGAITSVVFQEARYKSKNSTFDSKEPTSPKISCMGRIKHKKKISSKNKNTSISLPKLVNNPYSSFHNCSRNKPSTIHQKKKKSSGNTFNGGKPERKSDALAERSNKVAHRAAAPSLSQMKKFASGRDTYSKFDLTAAQVAPEQPDNRRHYSDEEKRDSSEEEQEDEVIIPFSAPLLLGKVGPAAPVPLKPREEINLWKRRTMAQPIPLQLNTLVTAC